MKAGTYYASLSPERREAMRARAREIYQSNRVEHQAKQRAKRAKNRDAVNANMRAYQQKNRESYYEYQAAHRFGVKRADIRALRAKSAVCEICGNAPNAETKRLAIDHDHDTGELRGVLCTTCNLGLGTFKDDPALLYKAFMYLTARKKVGEVA